MKRILITVGAVLLAAVPATMGLVGNTSFAQNIPVRVPSQASVLDDHGDLRAPTAAELGDDNGGQGTHAEPGDDKSGSSAPEPGDDKSGSSAPKPSDVKVSDKVSGKDDNGGHVVDSSTSGGKDDGSGHS